MISLITKIFNTLTWRLAFLYMMTSLIGVIGYTVYEQRDHIFGQLLAVNSQNASTTFTLSKRTELSIRDAANDLPWVVGVAVMSADLRLNEARTLFYMNRVGKPDQFTTIKKYPIFSNQEDSNITAIQLINGEFSCVDFNKTPLKSLTPELSDTVKSVCRISIPSYYGYFSGFIIIFLNVDPDQTQQQQIKLVFSSLSTTIYFKDMLSTQRNTLENSLP
jgi:hypothetical protein